MPFLAAGTLRLICLGPGLPCQDLFAGQRPLDALGAHHSMLMGGGGGST
jgi:hypothetical protein